MTQDQPNQEPQQNPERAPSDPERDPKVHPAPPGNPDVDRDDVERGQENIEKIVGN